MAKICKRRQHIPLEFEVCILLTSNGKSSFQLVKSAAQLEEASRRKQLLENDVTKLEASLSRSMFLLIFFPPVRFSESNEVVLTRSSMRSLRKQLGGPHP